MPSLERWKELEDQVEAWNDNKPWHFRPLWIREETSPFPEIWMTGPSHGMSLRTAPLAPPSPVTDGLACAVVGQQYYSLAKIVLGTFDPRLSRLGFGSHKIRKASEVRRILRVRCGSPAKRPQASIVEHLRTVIGLAISNEGVPAATFHASHILCACERPIIPFARILGDLLMSGRWILSRGGARSRGRGAVPAGPGEEDRVAVVANYCEPERAMGSVKRPSVSRRAPPLAASR